MSLLTRMSRLGRKLRLEDPHTTVKGLRICRFEEIEARVMMAADLHVGSVYYEQHAGDDAQANILQFSFEGGAPGTQLTRIVIDGDKDGQGRSSGDVFFDTEQGGLGSFKPNPYKLVSSDGFSVVSHQVIDGGMKLVLDLSGFEAGEKLVIEIDVDESQFVSGTTIDTNAVVEGGEFQRSKFTGSFVAPHYEDVTANLVYFDEFDQTFSDVEAITNTHLDLPPDRYIPSDDLSNYTAGAVTSLKQTPKPNSIAGVVFLDNNLNNHQDPGDLGISNVIVTLQQFDGQSYVPTGLTTVTDTLGNYKFDNLLPGKFRIVETQPIGLFSVGAQAGTVDGVPRGIVVSPDIISEVELLGGEHSVHNDFAEYVPNSIKGHVGIEIAGDCLENPLGGVTMRLLDSNGNVIRTTKTDANGYYEFRDLEAGVYTVLEEQPIGYFQGDAHVGSVGGKIKSLDEIIQITLISNTHGVEYDFCELLPVSISGHVGVDVTGDCETNPDTPPIAGVVIRLLDANGIVVETTQTNAQGNYIFDNLAPGTYSVVEEQPAGYLQGDHHAGSAGGDDSVLDKVTNILLVDGVNAVRYDFCELLPVSISGSVHVDPTGDCENNPNAPPLAGVTIYLLNSSGVVIDQTQTDAAGHYMFDNLAPGTYGVREEQPVGYFNGDTSLGSHGGTLGNDIMTNVVLLSDQHAVDYDFCEIPPAELCGFVYVDLNNNGIKDPGEQGIGGVTLILQDGNQQPLGVTTITAADGSYCFTGLRGGTYSVVELQPSAYLDGLDSPGSAGGTAVNPGDLIFGAVLIAGMHAENYNFGELIPASISGKVVAQHNGSCEVEDGATPLEGVVVRLFDSSGNQVATTKTNANGDYLFTNLRPGTYSVLEETPAGFFEGDADVGSVGGTAITGSNTVGITLFGGTLAVDYDFCEIPPATISGNVFQDGPPIQLEFAGQIPDVKAVKDGKLTPDDKLLPGIRLQLRNGITGAPILGSAALPGIYAPNAPITTFTNNRGHYEFVGLAPGTYGVFYVPPDGYLSGIDTAGSLGGVVISPLETVDPEVLAQLSIAQGEEAIVRIGLPMEANSINNNFSVVVTQFIPDTIILPPLVLPPPPPPLLPLAQLFEPILTPPPPIFPFLVAPIITRPGGSLYTWHLSVVNAGHPRGILTAETVQLTSLRPEDEVLWKKEDLSDGEWTLEPELRAKGKLTGKRFRFGIRGATPVTGDFNGDGKTDIGVFKEGRWFIDLNDNGVWDAGDLWAQLGKKGDLPVTGDWDGDGKTDIGIYGPAWSKDPTAIRHEPGIPDPHNENTNVHKNIPRPIEHAARGERKLKLTENGKPRADLIDHVFLYGVPGDYPVVGDWNGDGTATIAVFRDGVWRRDLDGDGKWSKADERAQFGQPGDKPIVGDFNGDGTDELGIYRDGVWYIDTNGNGRIDRDDQVFQLGGPGDIPVVGDWNGDGRSEPGIYHDTSVAAAKPAA